MTLRKKIENLVEAEKLSETKEVEKLSTKLEEYKNSLQKRVAEIENLEKIIRQKDNDNNMLTNKNEEMQKERDVWHKERAMFIQEGKDMINRIRILESELQFRDMRNPWKKLLKALGITK